MGMVRMEYSCCVWLYWRRWTLRDVYFKSGCQDKMGIPYQYIIRTEMHFFNLKIVSKHANLKPCSRRNSKMEDQNIFLLQIPGDDRITISKEDSIKSKLYPKHFIILTKIWRLYHDYPLCEKKKSWVSEVAISLLLC